MTLIVSPLSYGRCQCHMDVWLLFVSSSYNDPTGSLASSIMETTMVIQDGLGEKFALAVQFVSSFVFGLAVALYYSWQ